MKGKHNRLLPGALLCALALLAARGRFQKPERAYASSLPLQIARRMPQIVYTLTGKRGGWTQEVELLHGSRPDRSEYLVWTATLTGVDDRFLAYLLWDAETEKLVGVSWNSPVGSRWPAIADDKLAIMARRQLARLTRDVGWRQYPGIERHSDVCRFRFRRSGERAIVTIDSRSGELVAFVRF